MATAGSPLVGSWANPGGANPPTSIPPNLQQPNIGPSPINPQLFNPGGYSNPRGANEVQRNTALTNIQTGQMRNQMIPLFSQLMQKYGGSAGDFFSQLMNLGSPFYQRKQQQSFEQGTKAGQDAAATSRQQIQASGTGGTPSGVGAAAFGGEAQAEAGNQEEAFLNNLFQNEQLQTAGASGIASLAQLFNPAQLTGQQTSQGGNISQPSNFFQNFDAMMQGIFGEGGAAGGASTAKSIGGF